MLNNTKLSLTCLHGLRLGFLGHLSQAAATEIGMMRRGVARARIEVLQDIAVPETD